MERLVVCDFDGTIYRKNDIRHLSRAMKKIKELSVKMPVAIASGRPLHLLKPFTDEVSDIYIISCDGALVTKNDEILYECPIDKEVLKNVDQKAEWTAYGQMISYIHSKSRSYIATQKKMFFGHGVETADISEINENIYKIFFTDRKPKLKGLKKCYASYGIEEFTSENADKGMGVLKLSEMLNIKRENIVAFGDGENDLSMFSVAGESYAYIGASPKVRNGADGVFSDLAEKLEELL